MPETTIKVNTIIFITIMSILLNVCVVFFASYENVSYDVIPRVIGYDINGTAIVDTYDPDIEGNISFDGTTILGASIPVVNIFTSVLNLPMPLNIIMGVVNTIFGIIQILYLAFIIADIIPFVDI